MAVRKRKRRVKKTSTYFPSIGNMNAPVLLIIDPVVGNENAQLPLAKGQLQWFAKHLADNVGLKREDCFIVSCAPPMSKERFEIGKEVTAHLKEHRQELLDVIRASGAKIIMPFGAKACQQVVGRAVQITKVRGQPFDDPDIAHGRPVLPMLSPFFAQRQPENEAAFVGDLQTARRMIEGGYDIDASAIDYKRNYRWCWDVTEFKRLLRGKKRLSVDVEGVGLQGFKPDTVLLTVQFSWEEGESISVPIDYDRGKYRHHNFIPWDEIDRDGLIREIKKVMEDPRIEIVGQNFKFDWLYLWYMLGIETRNYADDSQLLSHLLDENQRTNNIDDLVRRYVPEMAGFNDAYNHDPEHHEKTRMDLLTPEKMLPYGCGDPDAAMRLCDVLKAKVAEDPKLLQCYEKVTMPAQRAFCYIEQNGFPVSRKQLTEFERKLRLHQKKERGYLLRQIPKVIRDKHRDTGVGLKPTRAAILIDWLYEHRAGLRLKPVLYTKTKQPSISSKQALPYYVADHPIVQRLIDYIKNDKLLTTYAKGFHKYIFDDLIRPSYHLAKTVTGRSASSDPNGQNFPKRGKMAKEYRKIFQAPKGWVFISCDLSQAELRIAAMMSGDPNMLKVYADGGDIHRTTAAGVMGISVEEFLKLPADVQGLKRFQAKAVNFGFLYGMWWVKFRSYAKTDYGIDFTEEEAKEIREMFFRTYPMLEYWHEDVQEYVTKSVGRNRARGYIRTYDGRIRHLPNVNSPDEGLAKQAMRQAINSPVQSIASDLGLMTLGRLLPYINRKKLDWIKPCGFIHDAIVCLVREDKVAHGCDLVKRFMENNPLEEWFDWSPEIPILADAEIGRTLASTYELGDTQFVGRQNRSKSYTDLVAEERDKVYAKYLKETDSKKRTKLLEEVGAIEADIALSSTIPSRYEEPAGKLVIKRSNRHANKTKTSKVSKGRSRRVRAPIKRGKGKIQRSQSSKDKAA